jgi:hypothetical protein
MRVVAAGAGGFIGRRLTVQLLSEERALTFPALRRTWPRWRPRQRPAQTSIRCPTVQMKRWKRNLPPLTTLAADRLQFQHDGTLEALVDQGFEDARIA